MWYTEAVLVCTRMIFLYAGSDSVYTEAIFLYTGCFVCSTEVILLYTGRFYGAQGALLREHDPLLWKFLEFFCTRASFCCTHGEKACHTPKIYCTRGIKVMHGSSVGSTQAFNFCTTDFNACQTAFLLLQRVHFFVQWHRGRNNGCVFSNNGCLPANTVPRRIKYEVRSMNSSNFLLHHTSHLLLI